MTNRTGIITARFSPSCAKAAFRARRARSASPSRRSGVRSPNSNARSAPRCSSARSAASCRPMSARDIAPHVEAMAAAAGATLRAASGARAKSPGRVRITASEIVGAEVLPPLLAEFRRANPGVKIELALSNRVEDLLRGEADIAVRMARPSQEALVARRIGSVGLGLYAHRLYLATAPPLTTLAALTARSRADRLRSRDALSARTADPLCRSRATISRCAPTTTLRNSPRSAPASASASSSMASRAAIPNSSRSSRARSAFTLEMWLALHEDLRASRRLRLMMDHLAAGLAEYVARSQP